MTRRIVRTAIAATTALATGGLVFVLSSTPAQAETVEITLHEAVEALPVAEENGDGYDRDEFPHWSDADGNGCNTRYEVLIDEAVEDPEVSDDCQLTGGKWLSYFDGEEMTDASDTTVDHFVPLSEAWASGARDWTIDDRERFANDLEEERTLVAVTQSSNSSKGDKDPAEWMPPVEEVHCQYLEEWVVGKTRWDLTANQTEKDSLTEQTSSCDNTELTIEKAF